MNATTQRGVAVPPQAPLRQAQAETRFKVSTPSWNRYRLAVAVAALLALVISFTPQSQRLETLLPRWASPFMAKAEASDDVVVLAIDQETLKRYGDWPWSRDRIARVLDRVRALQPAAIGALLPLERTQTPAGLETLRADLDTLPQNVRNRASGWLTQLDVDQQLARSMREAGNVVVAATSAPSRSPHARHLERFAFAPAVQAPHWRQFLVQGLLSPPALADTGLRTPLPRFLEASAALGVTPRYRHGQSVQGVPTVARAAGHYLPGLELALLAVLQGIDLSGIELGRSTALRIGARHYRGATQLGYYPLPAAAPPVYSVQDVLDDRLAAARVRGKAVLLGLTVPGLVPGLQGPAGQAHTPVSWSAQVLGAMLQDKGLAIPAWGYAAQRALLVLLALYFALLPASWHRRRATLLSGLLGTALLNTGLLTLVLHALWLPLVAPLLFLVAMQTLLTIASRRACQLETLRHEATAARLALGRNLQSQGQLDSAMDQFMRCLPAPAAHEPLYELGLEYERRRQPSRAQTIYARLESCPGGFRDTAARRERLAALSERFPNADGKAAGQTLVLDNPVMELPVLGRYRLQRELGSGAMGTVYLASDPNIGREVAVKALPLLNIPAGAEREDAAARFFREAEAVGRLDHPNIVTLHDVGQEHDLAFMAMDFVPGESLDAWTQPSTLLPVWEVLETIAQIAAALDYAHHRKVVHRDIKPSNIIYDRASGTAKVTDFGVARMLDSSRTRTGTVLGSPSYMSPEQVAGSKVDGRSDLFSLGTTLYQLLSGRLPFVGDSVATVMYQIANTKTPPLRKTRRGLPTAVVRLVMRALQKDPARRFARGADMAAALQKCRAQLRGGRRKSA
jgi:serine/threonine-protein kinase